MSGAWSSGELMLMPYTLCSCSELGFSNFINSQDVHRYATFSKMLEAESLLQVLPGVKSTEEGNGSGSWPMIGLEIFLSSDGENMVYSVVLYMEWGNSLPDFKWGLISLYKNHLRLRVNDVVKRLDSSSFGSLRVYWIS